MNPIEPKIRPPRKKHGGKFYLARPIVQILRPKVAYAEPFAAGASVLLNKPKSAIEIYNDLDWLDANIFACLRDHPEHLTKILSAISYDEETFKKWKEPADVMSKLIVAGAAPGEWSVHAAASTIVRARFSRGGAGVSFASSERLRGGRPGDLNAWYTWRENDLPRTVERVRDLKVLCQDGVALFDTLAANEEISIYLDPTYLPEVRSHKTSYGDFEMSRDAHVKMLQIATAAKADVVISGYDSPLYNQYLTADRWRKLAFDLPNNSSQSATKQRRVEIVWFNFDPDIIPDSARSVA